MRMLPRPRRPRAVQSGLWQNWACGSIGIPHEARFGDHAWRNAWWARAFQRVTPSPRFSGVLPATSLPVEKKVPELTLDRVVWLLRSALPEGHLSEERAILLMDYYTNRNRVARASHEKTWREKHKKEAG